VHLAVFGGTFDPPHNGHLALCLFARELLNIDRFIVSVSNNPFKHKRYADDEHRKRMAGLLSSEINLTGCCSEVSCWEVRKRQSSYTVDLLQYIHSIYPHNRLTLLIGEDSFRTFNSWKDYEQLYLLCNIVVFGRASSIVHVPQSIIPQSNETIRFIDFSYPVSSTTIRELVASGQSIKKFVPLSVHHYIMQHGLYQLPALPTLSQAQKHRES